MSFSIGTEARRPLRMTHGLSGLVLGLLAGLAGCGKSDSLPVLQVYDVKGKVLLADGKPLSGGQIYFVPKGDLPLTPSGDIGPDGTFSLVTGGSGEGAPPGEYKVRIESRQFQADGKVKKSQVPVRYNDEDSSGVLITVRAGTNQLDPILLK
jgi:hypothetical protein